MQEEKVKENYQKDFFRIAFDILLIFGLPVIVGALIGARLDSLYDTGKKITLAILAFTFIFSWIIFIIRFKKISK